MQIRERLQLQAHNAPGPAKAFSVLRDAFLPSILHPACFAAGLAVQGRDAWSLVRRPDCER